MGGSITVDLLRQWAPADAVAKFDAPTITIFKTWSLVTAMRIAAESEATRIAAKVHGEATRIAPEVEAARIAAEVEATRIAAEVEATRIDARVATEVDAARMSAVESASPHRHVKQSPEYKQAEREKYEF